MTLALRRTASRVILILVGIAWAAACAPGERTVSDTLVPFFEAVHGEDYDALFCLMAGAAGSAELGQDPEQRRKGFRAWAGEQFRAYEEGRDEGWLDLAGDPIRTAKLFSLGRGVFYSLGTATSAGEDGLRVDSSLRFGYGQANLSRLSVGTTFYMAGAPAGRVVPVRVPAGPSEVRVDVLESLELVWELVRVEPMDGCPGGWKVAAAVPVPDSAVETEIIWTF